MATTNFYSLTIYLPHHFYQPHLLLHLGGGGGSGDEEGLDVSLIFSSILGQVEGPGWGWGGGQP